MATGMLGGDSGFGSGGFSGSLASTGTPANAFGFQEGLASQQGKIQGGLLQQSLAGQLALQAPQIQLGYAGLKSQQQIAQTQAQASEVPAQLQQQRFGQVFPYLSSALSGLSSSASGTGQGATPLNTTGQPSITAGGVYSPNQMQQQVNSMRATNDASTAGQVKSQQNSASGRGVGANSPLSQALSGQFQNANLQANTAGENQIRQTGAQQNAQQMLSSQQAQEGQYASRQQESIQRQQIAAGQYNALISALGGLV